MNPWEQRGLIEDVLARAMDDWLHAAEFSGIVRRTGMATAEGVRAAAIGLIAQVLVDGLMVAGDVDELGFHQWPGPTADAIVRIVQCWDPAEPFPTPGSVAWFECTARGKQLGEAVIERESS
jgi:hypothetical protein